MNRPTDTDEPTPTEQEARAAVMRVADEPVRTSLLAAIDEVRVGGSRAAFHTGLALGHVEDRARTLQPYDLRAHAMYAWNTVYDFAKAATSPGDR